MNVTLNTAKAWVALLFLIVTALLGSPVIPVAGTAHAVLAIVAVLVGAISTYLTPANPSVKNSVK